MKTHGIPKKRIVDPRATCQEMGQGEGLTGKNSKLEANAASYTPANQLGTYQRECRKHQEIDPAAKTKEETSM